MVVGSTLRLCLFCTFGNLKGRRVVPFESCFLCGLCVLSIRSCGALPRWYLGPLWVRASSIALLDNLKEHRVTHFEVVFVAGTMRADLFSPTGPSFLKGLVFVLVDLVIPGLLVVTAGISLSVFGLFCFFGWPPVPRSLVAVVLSLIPRNMLLGAVTSGDSF